MTKEEKQRAKNARYHARHRDAILSRSRARYAEKREADLARKKAQRKAHHEVGLAYSRAYYYGMPPAERQQRTRAFNAKYAEKRRQWRERNKERLAKLARAWTKANMGVKRAATARRLAAKLRATPPWVDHAAIQAIYSEAARLTKETGIKHEVDHIVPLKSALVCGLHVHTNLQILTKFENRRKWNHLRPPSTWFSQSWHVPPRPATR